ncbi:MAG: hypothetical protein A3I66_06570 [Burkholderiales bacterium RIFCSPLOWO2_02_FULL_57_36]|nr:MAG: hypothetical protein A3I66_06570 [Burkholderiales bacterium RIFCSPLOWO2_02_FULL_57_36]
MKARNARNAWKAFSISFVLLSAKGLATSIYQTRLRIKATLFVSPEDAYWMRTRAIAGESLRIQRVSAVWRNNLENIPYFLAVPVIYRAFAN